MSDRIAVFNRGRIEQVGAPAQVYEHPATVFVAGFVGTSNLLTDAVARDLLGRDGVYSVRPEKIRLLTDGAPAAPGEISAAGTVAEVSYAGPATRFLVDLDAGVRLAVLAQNQQSSSAEVAELRGRPVRLAWRAEHAVAVPA